jgi:signal transduction histidine kinase
VLDNGPGIPQAVIGRVFDRFFRVPGSVAGGSGLGLAIARTAAERHGLRIELRNRDDGPGLMARVHLPSLPT